MPFTCSICEQESSQICEFCTKDTCAIPLCRVPALQRLLRCDVPLTVQAERNPGRSDAGAAAPSLKEGRGPEADQEQVAPPPAAEQQQEVAQPPEAEQQQDRAPEPGV